MAGEHPSAARREALHLVCAHGPLSTAEMAGVLVGRLAQRGLISEIAPTVWTVTDEGRVAGACPA